MYATFLGAKIWICQVYGATLGLALNILACRFRDLAKQCVATCTEQLAVFHLYFFLLSLTADSVKDETLSDILICSTSASLLSMPRPLSALSTDFMQKSYVLCAVCVLDQGFSNIFWTKGPFHSPKLFINTNWFFNLYKLAHIDTFYNNWTF